MTHPRLPHEDFEVAADVAYSHAEVHAASGLLFRYAEDGTGYAVGLREIGRERIPSSVRGSAVLQLYRLERDGGSRSRAKNILGCRSGVLRGSRWCARDRDIWVYDNDMKTPVLSEYDPKIRSAGLILAARTCRTKERRADRERQGVSRMISRGPSVST